MKVIGLTGGIGSGKSEVAARICAHGALVIDADVLAHEVVAPGSAGLAQVIAVFGDDLLRDDRSLDRARLGARVFGDDVARRRLESIVHPLVRTRAAELERAATQGIVVHAIPLLVETGQQDDFDLVVVVDVPEELQRHRLVASRGLSEAQAQARIDSQATRSQRLAAAGVVIDNTGTLTDLDRAVERAWPRIAGPSRQHARAPDTA